MGRTTLAVAALAALTIAPAMAAELDPVKVPSTATPEVRQIVEKGWPKVLAACPALNRYRADLLFKTVEDNLSFAPPNAKRVEIVYQVKQDPKSIPAEFMASGHTCYYGISPDTKKLSISKRPCASICRGLEQKDPLIIELR